MYQRSKSEAKELKFPFFNIPLTNNKNFAIGKAMGPTKFKCFMHILIDLKQSIYSIIFFKN